MGQHLKNKDERRVYMRPFLDSLKTIAVVAAIVGILLLVIWLLQMFSLENILKWFGTNWSGMLVGVILYAVISALLHRRS